MYGPVTPRQRFGRTRNAARRLFQIGCLTSPNDPGIRLLPVRDMTEHVVGDHRIETAVGEWDRLGVELPKAERTAAGLQSLPGLLAHA